VREPSKGCPVRLLACRACRAGPSGKRARLRGAGWVGCEAGTAKRVGGAWAKSRVRFPPVYPRRAKPKGASSGRHTNPVSVARDSRKGQSPETGACWAGPSLRRREHRLVERYVGSSVRKRAGYLPRGEGSEGRIPRAPPARKKAGTGSEGVNRREGSQTLRAERSGRGQRSRTVDLRSFVCCREREPMRGACRLRRAG
jgi:hypothetical protein